MSQPIDINAVRWGVNATLDAAFPNVKIMGEEITAGLDPPCFFVRVLQVTQDQELSRRHKRVHSFDVHYFSQDRANEDMYAVADKLFHVLAWIDVADRPIRGVKMRPEIIDEVLHFFVQYEVLVWEQRQDQPKINKLDLQGGVKP